MIRYAFRMQLFPGQEAEYERRHDELWPEMADTLHAAGVSNFTIWLDRETLHLFAVLYLVDNHTNDQLPQHPVVKKWWAFMRDIMETNPDNSPVVTELKEVFHLD